MRILEQNQLVSVVIPVYNSEKHLKECITSILNQTYRNVEIILINDGSTDKSGELCENFKKNDSRIKVLHQKNLGPSAARNKGINIALGKYIQFVDSDDHLNLNMIEKLVLSMNPSIQLVISGITIIRNENGEQNIKKFAPAISGNYKSEKFINHFGELYKSNLINSPCNKLYRTEILREFDIHFKEDVKMGEDLLFNLNYLQRTSKIGLIKDELYNYMIYSNPSSLSGGYIKDYFENQQMLFDSLRKFLNINNDYSVKNRDLIEEAFTNSIINCFSNIFHPDEKELTPKNKIKLINNIVLDEKVRNNIISFKKGNIQKKIIGYLINYNCNRGIYLYFKNKISLQTKCKPIFYLLRKINK